MPNKVAPALLLALWFLPFAPPAEGQATPPGADSVATEFQSALRGVAWRAAVALTPPALMVRSKL